jgi:hypothetical protein
METGKGRRKGTKGKGKEKGKGRKKGKRERHGEGEGKEEGNKGERQGEGEGKEEEKKGREGKGREGKGREGMIGPPQTKFLDPPLTNLTFQGAQTDVKCDVLFIQKCNF